jgi:hypothetical protein
VRSPDKPLPFYKWFWQEYRANRKVQRMGYVARGLYRELLDECWAEGSIPDDLETLADICGCPVAVMETEWQLLKGCFISKDGRLINGKLHSVRTEEDAARVAMSEGGRKGGLKSNSSNRTKATLEPPLSPNKPPSSQPDIEEKRREENKNLSSPYGMLGTASQVKTDSKKSDSVSEENLIDIYRHYPRREDRADALRAIRACKSDT